MEKVEAAGAIVYRKTDTGKPLFLVVKDNHGNWGFPKGHKEEGESDIETALRELEEEIGIKKDEVKQIEGFKESVSYKLPDGREKQVVFFLFETDKEKLDPNQKEIEFYEWMLTYEAIGRVTFLNMAMLINQARDFLMQFNKDDK